VVGVLLLPSVTPAIQQGFGVGAQAICFCSIVTILDLSLIAVNLNRFYGIRRKKI
jgi:hypothetical protein